MKIYRYIVIALILGMASCMAPQRSLVEDEADSTLMVVDTLPMQEVILPFPDTMYPSAEKIMYVVDTIEMDIPMEMQDLQDPYEEAPGIFTFRGSLSRNPNFFGRLHGDSVNIQVDWVFTTGIDTTHTHHGVWGGGTGWTGQPIYIPWPDSLQELVRLPLRQGLLHRFQHGSPDPT